MRIRFAVPLLVFLVLAALLVVGLQLNPRRIPSPLVGKPAPAFALPVLDAGGRVVTPDDFRGEVWVLNVWASWCKACLEEHPLLVAHFRGETTLVGLNYKDERAAAREWLDRWGDPYALSLVDGEGKAGLDWGVYGVPETFVVDAGGVIRHKHIGPLSRDDITGTIIPLTRRLAAEGGDS